MIETAVYSIWTKPQQSGTESNYKPTSGFPDMECFLNSWALSVRQARRYFKKVLLFTDELGKKLLCDETGIFKEEEVSTIFETYEDFMPMKDMTKELWSYGKMIVYSQMNEPFVHLDYDAFMFKPLRDEMKHAKVVAQSLEDGEGRFYKSSREFFKENNFIMPQEYNHYEKNVRTKVAYNCGIYGGCDYLLLQEVAKKGLKCVADNYDKIMTQEESSISDFNVAIEQYLATAILHYKGVRAKLMVKHPYDLTRFKYKGFGWVHLLGHTKFSVEANLEVRKLLNDTSFEKYKEEPVLQDWEAMIERLK